MNVRIPLVAIFSIFVWISTAGAALDSVSGWNDPEDPEDPVVLVEIFSVDGLPEDVAVSLANGFPMWYWDGTMLGENTPLKLSQCLDTAVDVGGGVMVNPCDPGVTFPQFPPSLSNLSTLPYWQAEAAFNYESTPDPETGLPRGGLALLQLGLRGGAADEGFMVDGNQAVFSRIRLRIDLPVPGTYRVTHPFGRFDYVITEVGERAIDQTQNVGRLEAQNFLTALRDRDDFAVPDPFDPAEDDNGAVVNEDGSTIGPFLVPTLDFSTADFKGGPVSADLNRYIGLPLTPDLDFIFQPVSGSLFVPEVGSEPTNYFRIEMLRDSEGNPPNEEDGSFSGFFLDAAAAVNFLHFTDFQVKGKIFNDGPNQAPSPPADLVVGVLKGRAVLDIDVFADLDIDQLDPVDEDNVHGIDNQAIALADPVSGVFRRAVTNMPFLTEARPTEPGGIVRRVTRLATGQSLFRYDMPSGEPEAFTDTFHYVVQDTGGLISEPASMTVVVEDLQVERADFRVKTGKWHVSGSTDQSTENTVTLFAGPRARLTGEGLEPAVETSLSGDVSLLVGKEKIDYSLVVEGLPVQNSVSAVNLHVDAPGSPVIFRLCGNPFISPFPPSCAAYEGVLTLNEEWTVDDLRFAAGAGVLDFDDAVDVIFAGSTYVNVVTAANPAGEIRSLVSAPQMGVATVDEEGGWEFRGKAQVLPGRLPSVSVRSALGAQTFSEPVSLR